MAGATTMSWVRSDRWYPWVVMGVAFFGTFLAIINTTTVNVLLPVVASDFGIGRGLEWIVTAYLLAVGVTQPATGWLVERFGRRRTYALGLAVFTIGSALVGVAPSMEWMVTFRLVQGVGGGLLLPVALTLVVEAFPPDRRGGAMGIWGIALMVAPVIGPVVGGWLATSADWRWMFLLNVPMGVLGALFAWRLLRDGPTETGRRLDVVSLGLVGSGVTLLLVALSDRGSGIGRGELLAALGAITLVALFAHRQLQSERPLIDVRMFGIPAFRRALVLGWMLMFAQHARLFLIPLELEAVRGTGALEAGAVIAPSALGTALFMPLGGRMVDRVGPRTPIVIGMTLMGMAAWQLAHVEPDTPLMTVMWIQVVQGIGAGFALLPATLASLNAVPTRLVPQASALRSVNQQLAAAIAVTALAAILVAQMGSFSASDPAASQAAYNRAFLAVVGVLVLGLPLAWRLPGRTENRLVQEQRAREVEVELVDA